MSPGRGVRGSAPLSSLCLGSHKPRPGEPRLWGTGRQGPYQPSALGSARCPQVGIVEQPLNESTGEVEAWSPPVPSPATGPRPRQRPEPGRTTRDAGTEGLPGDSEQTCKLSEHGLRGGRRAVGQDHYLGTKDQFWRKGRDASARPQTPGQRRVVCTGHSTHRVGTPPPGCHDRARLPRSRGPRTVSHPRPRGERGAGQCGGGTYQRGQDAPALLICAALGEDGRVRAEQQRGRQHPARGPRRAGQQRAPPAPTAPPAPPAPPGPAPRHDPPPAPRPAVRAPRSPGGSAALRGSAGEGARGRGRSRGGGGPAARLPAPGPFWGWGRVEWPLATSCAPAGARGKRVSARRSRGPLTARPLHPPHPATFSTFFFFHLFPQEDQFPLLNRIRRTFMDSNSPHSDSWFLC